MNTLATGYARAFFSDSPPMWFLKPDALLRRLPENGGLTGVNEAGYLAGPSELTVEVAASSASIELRDKRRAYCRNGVREYLVWLVTEARLE